MIIRTMYKVKEIFKNPKIYDVRVTSKNSNFWKNPILKILKAKIKNDI